MFNEIYPYIFKPEYINKVPTKDDYIIIFKNKQILLCLKDDKYSCFPTLELVKNISANLFSTISFEAKYLCRLFHDKNKNFNQTFFIFDADNYDIEELLKFDNIDLYPITFFRTFEKEELSFVAVTGFHVYSWLKSRKFCGYCGNECIHSSTERAMVCKSCHNIEYPKISPAIIVAVIDKAKDRILLTKTINADYSNYALVAGFIEIGETPIEALKREVMEEVGLKVKNIKSYNAQPWGFSSTLMLAFTAELDGNDEIHLQKEELKEAKWFDRKDTPVLDYHISVGQEIIARFRNGELEF